MYKIEIERLINELKNAGIEIEDVIQESSWKQIMLGFKNSNLRYVILPVECNSGPNCINIYHSANIKSDYWWINKLDYKDFVQKLLKYHSA